MASITLSVESEPEPTVTYSSVNKKLNEHRKVRNQLAKEGWELVETEDVGKLKQRQREIARKHREHQNIKRETRMKDKFVTTKKEFITKYSKPDLLVFKLLNNNIKIVDETLKNSINRNIDSYEKLLTSINETNNFSEFNNVSTQVLSFYNKLNELLTNDTYIDYVLKGKFINSDGVNLRNTDEFKDRYAEYNNKLESEKIKTKEFLEKSRVKKGLSFAAIASKLSSA